jgi:hypothetical protein
MHTGTLIALAEPRRRGLVSRGVAGQQRVYRLEPRPFRELDGWLALYQRLWDKHLDAYECHLESQE